MFYVLVNGLSLTGMNNGFAQSSQENVLSAIKNLRLGVHDAKTRIVMDVKGPITYRYFLLANPYRLVLDMLEVDFELNPAPRNSTGGVLGYRFGLLKPGISRVVVDLSKPFPITTSRKILFNSIAIDFVILKLQETIPPKALIGSHARADL